MDGPPYSVDQAEMESLFGDAYSIRLLQWEDILQDQVQFRERSLSRLVEKAYLLTANEESLLPT